MRTFSNLGLNRSGKMCVFSSPVGCGAEQRPGRKRMLLRISVSQNISCGNILVVCAQCKWLSFVDLSSEKNSQHFRRAEDGGVEPVNFLFLKHGGKLRDERCDWMYLSDELRDRHIPGGVYVAGVDDWRDCIDSCHLPCTAVDFDQNDLSCWHHHGPAACSQRKVYQPGVNHYRTVACLTHHRSPTISGLYVCEHWS